MSETAIEILSHKTWAALTRAGLSRSPENYVLWFSHISGERPALSQSIEAIVCRKGTITDEDCADLYSRFFSTDLVKQIFLDHVSRLLTQVQKIESDLQSTKNADAGEILSKSAEKLYHERVELENWLDESIGMIRGLRRETNQHASPVHLDALTGLADSSSFNAELHIRAEIALERTEPLSLAIVQIHQGEQLPMDDYPLQHLASLINNSIKGRDYLARSGEWELAMVLPRTRMSQADRLCQFILNEISMLRTHPRHGWMWGDMQVAIGLAQLHMPESPSKLLHRARDCVRLAADVNDDFVMCEDTPVNQRPTQQAQITLFPKPANG